MGRLGLTIVLFFDRNRIQLYRSDTSGVYVIDIAETIIKDLEMRDGDGFFTLIREWIGQVNVVPSSVVCIIGEAWCFSKDFLAGEGQSVENEIVSFLDHVPFETVVSKVYGIEKGKRVIAVNGALCDMVQKAFALQGFSVRTIVPVGALGEKGMKQWLNAESGSWAVKNMETLIHQTIAAAPTEEKISVSGVTQKKSSLPLLLGVFGFLAFVLVVAVLLQR